MNAKIIVTELPELKLAAISHIGAFDDVGKMFQKLMEWGHQKNVLDTSDFKAVTMYHDNPNVTHNSKLRYSACVTINQDIEADGKIRQINLEKGIYVVGRFEIRGEDISLAWKNMCIWIIESGYEFRDGDYFEMYHNDHRMHPELKFVLDICIPVLRTDGIELEESVNVNFLEESQYGESMDYHQLIGYMKELRTFFTKEYETYFKLGNIYQGNSDFSYFSLTTEVLKKQKLKFVIILNHKTLSFSICLSGQNKGIRKKYWEFFRDSDWNKYHLAESINDSLSIIDHVIVVESDFNDREALTKRIEKEAFSFINEIESILE